MQFSETLGALVQEAAHLFGSGTPGGHLDAARLRTLASRMTTVVAQQVDGREKHVYQPLASDLAGLAQPFKASQHVRPRRRDEYPDGLGIDDAREQGKLPIMSARGAFAIHEQFCETCRAAERAGEVSLECPYEIHVWCALLEGVWIPWREGPPSERILDTRDTPRYREGSSDPVEATIAAEMRKTIGDLVELGVMAPVPPALYNDPEHVMVVSQMAAALREKLVVPPEVTAAVNASEGRYDSATISAAARAAATEDASRYYAQHTADVAAKRRVDYHDAIAAAMRERAAPAKVRPILWQHRTLNPLVIETSLQYETIADYAGGVQLGDVQISQDGSKAYYLMRWRPEYRRYHVVQCPVTLKLYWLLGLGMGFAPSCAIFAGPMALLRKAIEAGPPARRGEVHVKGLQDDTMQSCRPEALGVQKAWTEAMNRRLAFLTNEKAQEGQRIEVLGSVVSSADRSVLVKPDKLYATLYALWFARYLAEAGAPAFISRDWFESLCGNVTWVSGFDYPIKTRRRGMYAALAASLGRQSPTARRPAR